MSRALKAIESGWGGYTLALEALDDVMFDTVEVPPQGGFARLFGKTVGDSAPRHGEVRTNQIIPNTLPNPHQFEVMRFYCAFFNRNGVVPVSHPVYWHSCVNSSTGDNNRLYWHSPCWAIAHPTAILGNLTGFAPEHLKAVIEGLTIGKLTSPIILRHGEFINGALMVDGQFAPLEFVFLMAGIRARSVSA